jgi:hypothetical protein
MLPGAFWIVRSRLRRTSTSNDDERIRPADTEREVVILRLGRGIQTNGLVLDLPVPPEADRKMTK